MFYRAFTLLGPEEVVLNPTPLDRVFKHLQRDPASVTAMKRVRRFSCIFYLIPRKCFSTGFLHTN